MYVLFNLLPLWATAAVIVGFAIVATIVASGSVHRRYDPESLRGNNEVAGYTFGVIGAIYGLLLALALVAVWGNYERARENAADEEACVISLHRVAWGLSAVSDPMETGLRRYERAANVEWGKAKAESEAQDAVDDIGHLLSNERDSPSAPFVAEGMARLDRLADLRAARRANTQSGMPGFLWAVMMIGGVVTVGFSLFFGSPNPRSQRFMTAILGATLALVLFAVLEMDHPYEGDIRVHSPFEGVR